MFASQWISRTVTMNNSNEEELLRDMGLLESIAIEQRYDNYSINVEELKNQQNWTARTWKVVLSSATKPDLRLFAKTPAPFTKEMRQSAFSYHYKTERIFYTNIARKFETIQDEHNVKGRDRFLMPTFFGCNPNYLQETIVLEDLSSHGFEAMDRLETVDWRYAAKAVEEMAKFHALSIAYGEVEPDNFKKLLRKMDYAPRAFKPPYLDNFVTVLICDILEVTKEEYRLRLKQYVEHYGLANTSTPLYKPLLHPVLAHGDFKFTNLMHREDADGELEIVILDYQTVRSGSTVADLMRFVFESTDRAFRKQYMHKLCAHYYQCLHTALKRHGVDADIVYPKEVFDEELKMVLPYGLMITLLLCALLMDFDKSPAPGDHIKAEFRPKPSKIFAERLNGAIEDYIDWGMLPS